MPIHLWPSTKIIPTLNTSIQVTLRERVDDGAEHEGKCRFGGGSGACDPDQEAAGDVEMDKSIATAYTFID
jgi:hypothetical protein